MPRSEQHRHQVDTFSARVFRLQLDDEVNRQLVAVLGWAVVEHCAEICAHSYRQSPIAEESWHNFHVRIVRGFFSEKAHRYAKRLRRWRNRSLYGCRVPPEGVALRLRSELTELAAEMLSGAV